MSSKNALEIVRRHGPDLPFMVVSGRIGEDAAVSLMKAGANDYVMKENLARLPAAIERAIKDAEDRRQRRIADERYRGLIEDTSDLAQQVGVDGKIVYVNRAWSETLGYSFDEAIGMDIWKIVHQDSYEHCRAVFSNVFESSEPQTVAAIFLTKSGRRIDVRGTVRERD